MSKILISWAVLVLAGWVLLYLGTAFAFLSVNPADWGQNVRAALAVVAVLWLGGLSYLASKVEDA